MDTCPIFVSDGGDMVVFEGDPVIALSGDRVVRMNKAYREMAGEEMVVVVIRKDGGKFPSEFSCNVRMVSCRSGRKCSNTKTVPCDV